MSELRERIARAIMAEDLLQDDRAKNEPDYCSVDARVDAVMSVLASWQCLMAILDEHYPPEVFDGSSGDEGPRIVALVREVDRLRREVEFEANPEEFYWTPPSPSDPCACVTDEQAAALPARFSRPVCAIHGEDEALLALAEQRAAVDTGRRTPLDVMARWLGAEVADWKADADAYVNRGDPDWHALSDCPEETVCELHGPDDDAVHPAPSDLQVGPIFGPDPEYKGGGAG